MSAPKLTTIEQKAIPGASSCAGIYIANTLASAFVMGMSLLGRSAQVAISKDNEQDGAEVHKILSPTAAIMDKGRGQQIVLITDRRFSGEPYDFVVGHITP